MIKVISVDERQQFCYKIENDYKTECFHNIRQNIGHDNNHDCLTQKKTTYNLIFS